MQAWEYSTIQDTLEKSLVLNSSAPIPSKSSLSKNQVLVEVITTSINPVDYKLPESGLTGKLMIKRPASPGRDFSGRVVAVHPSNSTLKGQLVFGAFGSPTTQFGTLRQFIVVPSSDCAVLPQGVDADHAAAMGTAAMTAFQSLLPDLVKPGSKVFINGGSGGVGTFGIQFAKLSVHMSRLHARPITSNCVKASGRTRSSTTGK
jgi:NADPH:quinone reductase-like Zn-dependent oxidoreductase